MLLEQLAATVSANEQPIQPVEYQQQTGLTVLLATIFPSEVSTSLETGIALQSKKVYSGHRWTEFSVWFCAALEHKFVPISTHPHKKSSSLLIQICESTFNEHVIMYQSTFNEYVSLVTAEHQSRFIILHCHVNRMLGIGTLAAMT